MLCIHFFPLVCGQQFDEIVGRGAFKTVYGSKTSSLSPLPVFWTSFERICFSREDYMKNAHVGF